MIAQDRILSGAAIESAPASGVASVSDRQIPAVLAMYLFCVVIPIGFHLGPLLMTTLRIFLLIVTLPLFFGILGGRYGRLLISDILFPIYVLWMAIALTINNPQQVVQQVGSTGIEFLGGYAMGRAYIRSPQDYLALCRALILVACLLVPFALIETITGTPDIIMFLKSVPGMVTVAIVNYEPRLGLERVQATFAHPIHFGLFCSIIFSQTFVALRGHMSNSTRYLLSAVVSLAGFLALSSGALLSIILQFFFVVWAFTFRSFRYKWWILLSCAVVAYILIDLASNRTPIMVFMSYATFSAETAYYRSIIFDWGLQNIWASPVFGIGMNEWFRPAWMGSSSVDNFWLLVAMQLGIPGFFILTIGLFWSMGKVMFLPVAKGTALENIRLAWVFTFFGLSFTLTTVAIWTNIYSFVFFMFGAGMWMISTPNSGAIAIKDPEQSPRREYSVSSAAGVAVPAHKGPQQRYSRFAPRTKNRNFDADGPS